MDSDIEIRLQLGSACRDFESFWNKEVTSGRISDRMAAGFRPEKRPAGGLGLVIPPEVFITLGAAALKGAAGAAGAGMAKLLWSKLREFFRRSENTTTPKEAVILVGEVRVVVKSDDMAPEPPPRLEEALK